MTRVRFGFGKVSTLDINTISTDRLADRAEQRGVIGHSGGRRGAKQVISGESYLYMRFAKEISEERTVFDNNDDVVQEKQYVARTMVFLLLDNGNYAFQSRRGVNDKDALDYIYEPFETVYDFERYDEFSLEQMRWFYKDRPRIRKLKVDNIGDQEPNPHWPEEDIQEVVEDTGSEADNSTFSVGRQNNNLKNVDIIDRGFARLSNLNFIRARDRGGDIQELIESGRFGFRYNDDLSEDEQSKRTRDTAIGILRSLYGDTATQTEGEDGERDQ